MKQVQNNGCYDSNMRRIRELQHRHLYCELKIEKQSFLCAGIS